MTQTTTTDPFWVDVDRGDPDECWEWQDSTNNDGYGYLTLDGEWRMAHRVAMELGGTDISNGQVNHHCDNPTCVNPNHLYLGTQSENIQDAYDRGRKTARGEDNGFSELSYDDVVGIRNRLDGSELQREIADDYGVSQSLVSKINTGDRW